MNLNLDVMRIMNANMKSEIYLEEVLSDNQRALLHYNHRYLLTHDENKQISEDYYDSLA